MQANNPKITVITVVYNAVTKIEGTILSALNQKYNNIEYIVIDGGSNDGTLEIIRSYENKISFWISEIDNGIFDAMNKGIVKASGEWINFLNAGDRYCDLNVLSQIFKKEDIASNVDVIYGNAILEKVSGAQIKQIASKSISELWKGPIFRHGAMFTRSHVQKENLFKVSQKYNVCSDFDFIYHIYVKGHIMEYVNCDILTFEEEGVSNNPYKNLQYNRMILLSYEHSFQQNLISLFRNYALIIYIFSSRILTKLKYRILAHIHNQN